MIIGTLRPLDCCVCPLALLSPDVSIMHGQKMGAGNTVQVVAK